MNDLAVRTVLTLTTGLSKTPHLWFAWGTKSEVITVGLRANWAVLADELLDVHLYLSFDGEQLLVAPAGPSAAVYINDVPIHGQRWWPVRASDTLRAGQAAFAVTREAPALSLGARSLNAALSSTISDGGQLRDHARALVVQAPPSPEPFTPREVPKRPLADTVVSMSPFADDTRLSSESPRPDAMATMLSVAPPTVDTPVPPKPSAWSQASRPKKAILLSLPLLAFALLRDPHLLSLPLPLFGWPASAKHMAAPQAVTERQPGPDTARELPAGVSSASPPASPASSAPTDSGSSSATLPSAAAPLQPLLAPSGSSATAAPLPATAAKAALDAAFLGNFQESARRYSKLAAEHPNEPSYGLAARLTADETVRRP